MKTDKIRECINTAGYLTGISVDVLNAAEAELTALETAIAVKDELIEELRGALGGCHSRGLWHHCEDGHVKRWPVIMCSQCRAIDHSREFDPEETLEQRNAALIKIKEYASDVEEYMDEIVLKATAGIDVGIAAKSIRETVESLENGVGTKP